MWIFQVQETERDASACIRRHQAFEGGTKRTPCPIRVYNEAPCFHPGPRESETLPETLIRGHQAFALAPVPRGCFEPDMRADYRYTRAKTLNPKP